MSIEDDQRMAHMIGGVEVDACDEIEFKNNLTPAGRREATHWIADLVNARLERARKVYDGKLQPHRIAVASQTDSDWAIGYGDTDEINTQEATENLMRGGPVLVRMATLYLELPGKPEDMGDVEVDP